MCSVQTGERADVTSLIVAFRNFINTLNNCYYLNLLYNHTPTSQEEIFNAVHT